MYTLLRFQASDTLRARGIHEFDAWASAFGDTRTELELQPSGAYRPVERFSEFVNVPELIDIFRSVADVVQKADLRRYLKLPALKGGQRQLITAPASEAFRDYSASSLSGSRRSSSGRAVRRVTPHIELLSVITDGRHAAIDMRLVSRCNDNEPENKLNRLIANVHRIHRQTSRNLYRRSDGMPFPQPGAGQLIFSDLGTLSVEEKRGFSAYR
jgi:hypothetical protein